MLKRLTATASLASALGLCALAAAAPPAQDAKTGDAQNDNRARPVLAPLPEIAPPPVDLPPVVPDVSGGVSEGPSTWPSWPGGGRGTGVGTGQGPGQGAGYGPGRGESVGGGETRYGGLASGGTVDYDRPFMAREVTSKAVITSKAEPGFTEESQRNEIEGIVRLRAVLAHDGKVKNISVIKGLPDGLTERAIAAARQIKFRPAKKDGRTVSQYVTLEYVFEFEFDREEKVGRKAVILEQPPPEYTEEARRHGVRGKVVLDVTLYRAGGVRVREVVKGLPHGLTEKAVEAAGKIKFTPAEDKGKRVTVVRRVEYHFPPE